MSKASVWSLCAATVIGCCLCSFSGTAKADPKFKLQWEARYLKPESSDEADKQFVDLVKKKAKCNVCHAGRSKKQRNAYGAELSKLLDRKKDKDNVEKIQQALETVGEMKVNPDDEKSMTWGELFAKGELPEDKPVKD